MAIIDTAFSLMDFEDNVLRIKVASDSGIDLEWIEQLHAITINT